MRYSQLNIVDLAGSERQKKAETSGQRLLEAEAIKSSLLVLGRVVSELSKSTGQASHIPYRDCKLTRVLQAGLGGNSRTVLLASVSPANRNFSETLSTLRFTARCTLACSPHI